MHRAQQRTVPPRWAFLVAYDAIHNASMRQPHPQHGRRSMGPVDEGSPVFADNRLIEFGELHLEAVAKHGARRALAKREAESGKAAAAAKL